MIIDEMRAFKSSIETRRFLSELLSCVNDNAAIMTALCSESIRTLVAARDTACSESDALRTLLYSSSSYVKVLGLDKDEEGEEFAMDTKTRRRLLKQFVEMGELLQSELGAYSKAPTRQVHFSDDLYLLIGTIPQAAFSGTSYSTSYSGAARYSRSSNASYVELEAEGWLPLASIDDSWFDSSVRYYSTIMSRVDVGAFSDLDASVLSPGSRRTNWVNLKDYKGDTITLLRVRLINSFEYYLVMFSILGHSRIVRGVRLDRDYAKQFECAHLARSGQPKRVRVNVVGDQVRFRIPRMPSLQQSALRHISHELSTEEGTWRLTRRDLLPIVEHIARSSRLEVLLT